MVRCLPVRLTPCSDGDVSWAKVKPVRHISPSTTKLTSTWSSLQHDRLSAKIWSPPSAYSLLDWSMNRRL